MMDGRRFLTAVLFDAAMILALILWVPHGNGAAETVFKVYFWIATPLSIVAYLVTPQHIGQIASSRQIVWYSRAVRMAVSAFLMMARETAMLSVHIAAWLAFEAACRWCVEHGNGKEPARRDDLDGRGRAREWEGW